MKKLFLLMFLTGCATTTQKAIFDAAVSFCDTKENILGIEWTLNEMVIHCKHNGFYRGLSENAQ